MNYTSHLIFCDLHQSDQIQSITTDPYDGYLSFTHNQSLHRKRLLEKDTQYSIQGQTIFFDSTIKLTRRDIEMPVAGRIVALFKG